MWFVLVDGDYHLFVLQPQPPPHPPVSVSVFVCLSLWLSDCLSICLPACLSLSLQLSPVPLDLVLNGAKIHQVSEHRLLGITIDNKVRWDSHTNNVCKTVSRRVFLLSKLRYIVDMSVCLSVSLLTGMHSLVNRPLSQYRPPQQQ